MDREIVLAALIALICGPVAWGIAPMVPRDRDADIAERERRAWRAIVLPVLAAGIGLAVLVGWALREPDATDERLAPAAWAVVGIVVAIWVRAVVRFVRGNLRRPAIAIGVIGLLRPRIVVHPDVVTRLDEAELVAALAHEEAHRRHRDPLRIALAQLASDVQWPWPQPRRRLRTWFEALEEARDAEAVGHGADPTDLAGAIVAVARRNACAAGAALTGTTAIERRIARLLSDEPGEVLHPSTWGARIVVFGLLLAALVVGLVGGDDLLAYVPGVIR